MIEQTHFPSATVISSDKTERIAVVEIGNAPNNFRVLGYLSSDDYVGRNFARSKQMSKYSDGLNSAYMFVAFAFFSVPLNDDMILSEIVKEVD